MEAKADKIDKNLYRKSTLGEALNTCLIDLKERQEINEDTKIQIEREFDNVMYISSKSRKHSKI